MFTPDLTLSLPATTRWKRGLLKSPDTHFSIAESKNLHRLVTSRDASKFLSISATPGLHGPRLSKNEDLREVSLQLVSLKKKHDVNKSLNLRNQMSFNKEVKFVKEFKEIEDRVLFSNGMTNKRVKKLGRMCEEVKRKQEEALESRKVYKHMLNRMRENKMFIDRKNFALGVRLKDENLDLGKFVEEKRKIQEMKIQTKVAYSVLETYVESQTIDRYDLLQEAKKDAETHLKVNENRELRIKRQVDIAEVAADEERNNRAMQVRESLILHRLLFALLDVKLQTSKRRFSLIDEAFRKIKNQYGFIEPLEMIEKILTKEQTYTELLASINYNNDKIIETNKRLSDIETKIQFLTSAKPAQDPNKQWKIIFNTTLKENSAEKEKLRKIKIIYDKIKFWAARLLQKLGCKNFDRKKGLKVHLALVKETIVGILKNDTNGILKSKNTVDGMKVDQVLKFFMTEETRRRTFSTIPVEEIDKIRNELVLNEEEGSSRKRLGVSS